MRPVIVLTLVVCVAVAMAPWFSGGQEPVAMLVSGLALLLGLLLVWRQPEVRRLGWGPLAVSWVALVGFALLSMWWSANRYSTAGWTVQWAMAGLAFWLAYVIAGERGGREQLVRAYLVSAGAFGVAALFMFFATPYPRLTGTFYWPNPAAAYLMPAIIIGLDKLRRASGRRAYWWVGMAGGFLALFWLTDSRAGSLVLLVFAVIYLAIIKGNRGYWTKLLFVLGLGIGLSFGLNLLSSKVAHHRSNFVPGSRFAEVAGGEPTSLKDRIYYLESGMAMWWRHPVGGTGAGTYGDVHPLYQQRVVSAAKNAHNFFVQLAAELGAVGLLALAAVGLSLVGGCLRGLVENPEMLPAALGAAAIVVHSSLDIDASYPSLLMLVAVLSGLVYSQGLARRRAARFWVPATAAVLLVPLVSQYQSANWAEKGLAAQADGDYAVGAEDFAAAHRGPTYNPDYVNAEGIDWYTLAGLGDKSARQDVALALDRARQAQSLDPYDGQHYQLEGRALAERGEFASAQRALKQALRLDRFNHPGYALDLATFQLLGGDPQGAVKTAKAMLALYPRSVVNNRNLDQTIRPTLANLEALVGNVALQRGDMSGAAKAAKRALDWDKNSLRGKALEVQVKKKTASGG